MFKANSNSNGSFSNYSCWHFSLYPGIPRDLPTLPSRVWKSQQTWHVYLHTFWICVKASWFITLPPDCPEPPNVIAIIGGSIVSVALIGILVLMLIKLLFYMRDLKEFKKFENEKKKSQWAKVRHFFITANTTRINHHLGILRCCYLVWTYFAEAHLIFCLKERLHNPAVQQQQCGVLYSRTYCYCIMLTQWGCGSQSMLWTCDVQL